MANRILCSLILSLTLLTGCAVTVGGSGDPGAPLPTIDSMKPVNEDYYGYPTSFNGRWEGACTYTRPSGYKADSCWVSVNLNQSTSYMSGTVTYVIDGRTGNVFLPQYQLDGNSLRDSLGRYAGRIGERAVSVSGEPFGELSLKRTYDGRTGLLISVLPEDRGFGSGARFSALLHQTY